MAHRGFSREHPGEPDLLSSLFLAGTEISGETFDGNAILEMLLYNFRNAARVEAEVPGAGRVDDDVWAVLAESEAVHAVHADITVHPRLTEFALERLAGLFGATFLAISTLTD